MAQPLTERALQYQSVVAIAEAEEEVLWPDINQLIPENDDPVDNLFSETQQRLLTEPLYSSWEQAHNFLAAANVGVYYMERSPSIGPDVLLALDVAVPAEFWSQRQRSYLVWEYGKPPDLVIEIVSKTVRSEDREKKDIYARMRVGYYAIFDPNGYLMAEPLTIYRWNDFDYERQTTRLFPSLGLGLTLWQGEYEGKHDRWLRWTDATGQLIPTGKERADHEQQRADQSEQLLGQERARTARLAELLRELGQDPEALH